MSSSSVNPFLVDHLSGKKQGRLPVWLMRQAGRYLPSYRSLREKHSFWEMVTTPDLAAEVTLLPMEVIPVDGAIFFSDILTLPYGMGVEIQMQESIGPVIQRPFLQKADFEVFKQFNPEQHTAFVGTALKKVRSALAPEVALLGFAGAPWTVAAYLIEGQGKTEFRRMRDWVRQDPRELSQSLSCLGSATVKYLKDQVKNGANLVQLFDTWLPFMDGEFLTQWYFPLLSEVIQEVKKSGVFVTYFSRGNDRLNELKMLPADVLSVDHSVDLVRADRALEGRFSLQGNLDPELLLHKSVSEVRHATRSLVQTLRTLSRPAIVNLGHGVLPKTPVENVMAFVEEARALWI